MEVLVAKPQTVHRLELVPPTAQRRKADWPRQVVDVTLRTSDRLLLTVEEAAARLGISRAYMWRLVSDGKVESIHVGRLRRIEPEALARYIARIRDGDRPPAA
jgi:excisionase family DNA binding protein